MVNPGRCADGQVVMPDDLPENVATRILINTITAWHMLGISLRALSTAPRRIVKFLSGIDPHLSNAQASVISGGSRCADSIQRITSASSDLPPIRFQTVEA